MARTIVVTGATGGVGGILVKKLSERGMNVRAGVHTPGSEAKLEGLTGVEPVSIDYARPETLASAMEGADSLYLVTPLGPDMVETTKNVVVQAVAAGIERVVKQSVIGAISKDPTAWGVLHRDAERVIQKADFRYTFIRPNSFMQNFSRRDARHIRQLGEFYRAHGDAQVSYIDARDIAEAAATVLTTEGHEDQAYTLTGPESLSYHAIADMLTEVAGRRVRFVPLSAERLRAMMEEADVPAWRIDTMVEWQEWQSHGHAAPVTEDYLKLTGRQPTSFRQFLADNADQFRAEGLYGEPRTIVTPAE
jgi:uncharacterized protein YbjT (DUF2867 family)